MEANSESLRKRFGMKTNPPVFDRQADLIMLTLKKLYKEHGLEEDRFQPIRSFLTIGFLMGCETGFFMLRTYAEMDRARQNEVLKALFEFRKSYGGEPEAGDALDDLVMRWECTTSFARKVFPNI